VHHSLSISYATSYRFLIADVALDKTQALLSKNTVEILFPSCREIVENANFLSVSD
jgi:preprotein translocase subunit SecB